MKRILILGAGITGLTAAWYLKKRFGTNAQVTILEKTDRSGGWIQTSMRGGFLFEQGPRSCRPSGAGVYTLKLIEELGLQDEVIAGDPKAHKRYIYADNRLRSTGLFSLLFAPSVLRGLIHDWMTPKGNGDDETIYQFASRRFNSTIAERYFDPMCNGIYAGDIRKLSLKACFPVLHQWEQERGSVIKGAFACRCKTVLDGASTFVKKMQQTALFSFKKGMQTLPNALADQLNIIYQAEIQKIHFREGIVSVETTDASFEGDHLISTLPAHLLAPLLPFADLKGRLSGMPTASLAVVNLGYREPLLKKQGFGYLIASQENEPNLGVVWDSCIFPEQNKTPDETRLTVMMGGTHTPHILDLREEELLHRALYAVSKQMNLNQLPYSYEIKLAKYAIPQYLVNHKENILKIEGELAALKVPLSLLGSSYYGVAVNDCIAKSYQYVQSASL